MHKIGKKSAGLNKVFRQVSKQSVLEKFFDCFLMRKAIDKLGKKLYYLYCS